MVKDGNGREDNPSSQEENPFVKYASSLQPVGKVEGESRHEQGSHARHRVRIVSRRVRLCDADNLIGGCKHAIDALRIAGIIPEDDPTSISLEVSQEKVSSYKKEETWIEVTR
ncbi:MAG: hypothetical protein CMC82_02475 [Flavobacteriaceae bacterium]|nr:hypothetical protein [Flavobacteriaceae bacterium]